MDSSGLIFKSMKSIFFFFLRKLLYLPVRIFLIKELEHMERIPRKGSAILVFNHQSFFDFICFIAIAPRNVYYLTAEKFYSHPVWKPIMRLTGQIKVERASKDKNSVHKEVYEHLKQDHLIGIFPEGTRSPHKDAMLPGYTGAARYSLETGIPLIPIGICGTYKLWSRHQKIPTIEKDVSFHVGEALNPEDYAEYDDARYVKTTVIVERLAVLSKRTCGGVHE